MLVLKKNHAVQLTLAFSSHNPSTLIRITSLLPYKQWEHKKAWGLQAGWVEACVALLPTDSHIHFFSVPSPEKVKLLAASHAHAYRDIALKSTKCFGSPTKGTCSNLVHRCFISDINTVCIVCESLT